MVRGNCHHRRHQNFLTPQVHQESHHHNPSRQPLGIVYPHFWTTLEAKDPENRHHKAPLL